MNRPLKFRAWDAENNEWLFDGQALDLEYSGEVGALMFDNDAFTHGSKSLKWVQWTGLLDSEGTEIYESDLVRCERLNSSMYCVTWDGREAAWMGELIGDGLHSYLGLNEIEMRGCVVFGNRFESPSLLEEG